MARVHPIQSNFTTGEVTPKLAGQVNFKKYDNALEILENMTIFPQGGVTRRPGTRFVAEIKDSSAVTRLIPFEFNVTQSYVLEFGNNYIRFYKDNGQITEADKSISNITQANPAVVTASSHGFSDGDHVWINSVAGMTELNGRRFTVANKTTHTFELSGINSSSFTAYSSGGTAAKVYEISTSYTSAQVFDLKFAQAADVMYIVHPSHEPAKLTRTGHTSWSLADVDFEKGPYLDTNTTATTLNPGSAGVGTGVALVASADLFASTDVGRLVKLHGGHCKITAFTDAQNVTMSILTALSASTATADWQLGSWSNTTGFPETVSFFEQRIVYGGTTSLPQTIFASQSGLFENFDVGTSTASDAFIYTIASNRVNKIRFLAPSRDLIVGTAGGEFKVGRPPGEPLEPGNVNISQQTTYGVHTTPVVQIGNALLFVQRQKRKIREFTYTFSNDSYVAPDMTLLSEHISEGGIDDVAYQQEPDSVYWACRNDGQLIGMTYLREQDVVGWHRHKVGGISQSCTVTVTDYDNTVSGTKLTFTKRDGSTVTFTSTTGTAGTNEFKTQTNNNTTASNLQTAINGHADFTATVSSAVVTVTETSPSGTEYLTVESSDDVRLSITNELPAKVTSITTITETNENQFWALVTRIINGSTVQYVEYFDDTLNQDSGLAGTVTGASTIVRGLNHLEGETVQILIDDAVYPVQKVTNGAVTISLPSTFSSKTIEIGLGFVSTMKTLKVEAGTQAGSAQGRRKRYNEVSVRLLNSVGVTVNGDQIPFRSSADEMGKPIPAFTGDKKVSNLGWDTDGQITIKQEQPLPLTVLSLTGTLVASD